VPLRLARIYRDRERPVEAKAVLDRERASFPDDSVVKANHANYLMDDGEIDAAAALLPPSVDVAQAEREVVRALVRLYSVKEDFESVKALTQEAIAATPKDAGLHQSYLLALEGQGERKAALAYIEALEPAMCIDAPGLILFQIEILLADGQSEVADVVRESYRAAYPNQVPTDNYLKGRIAFARKDLDEKALAEAKDYFTLAVEMNPKLQRARFFLALTLLEKKEDWPAARVSLEFYLRNNPDDRQARQLWARYFDRNRSVLELRVAGQRLLEEEGPPIDELLITAQDLLVSRSEEDKELARLLVEKSLALYPSSFRGYVALAGYYLQEGDVPEAEAILVKALAAGIDKSEFALLDASIALSRDDKERALAIAVNALADSDLVAVKEWATFFSRRGFLSAGQGLLDANIENAEGDDLSNLLIFRAELSLQFDGPAAALAQLRSAEGALDATGNDLAALNRIRVRVAERLLFAGDPAQRQTVDEILATIEVEKSDDDGIPVLRARMALRQSPPALIEALKYLDAVPDDSAYRDDAALMRAEVALLQGQYAKAERIAKDVAGAAPKNQVAWHIIGDAQMRLGNLETARASMERILKIDRSDERAMRLLVRIYASTRLRRKAEAMFTRYAELVAVRPDQKNYLADLRAFLAMQEGNYADAESSLREQVAKNPADYGALNGLAKALVARKKYDEALAIVRAYLEVEKPTVPEPWTFFGRLLIEQGGRERLGEASSAFTQAQLLVPGYAPAQLGNIEVQRRLGNDGVVIALCDRYLAQRTDSEEFNEQDAQVFFHRAVLRAKSAAGLAAALSDIDQALGIVEAPRFLRLRARLRIRQNDTEGAIEDIRRVRDLTGTLKLWDEVTMAEAYLGGGDLDNAQRYLQSARARADGAEEDVVAGIDALAAKLKEREAGNE
jgi:predicted Zn-dependent protease